MKGNGLLTKLKSGYGVVRQGLSKVRNAVHDYLADKDAVMDAPAIDKSYLDKWQTMMSLHKTPEVNYPASFPIQEKTTENDGEKKALDEISQELRNNLIREKDEGRRFVMAAEHGEAFPAEMRTALDDEEGAKTVGLFIGHNAFLQGFESRRDDMDAALFGFNYFIKEKITKNSFGISMEPATRLVQTNNGTQQRAGMLFKASFKNEKDASLARHVLSFITHPDSARIRKAAQITTDNKVDDLTGHKRKYAASSLEEANEIATILDNRYNGRLEVLYEEQKELEHLKKSRGSQWVEASKIPQQLMVTELQLLDLNTRKNLWNNPADAMQFDVYANESLPNDEFLRDNSSAGRIEIPTRNQQKMR